MDIVQANFVKNWSTFWKFSTLTCATAATFVQGMGPLALAPMFPQLIEAFDSNLNAVIQFTGVAILVLGFSNFIWYTLQFMTSYTWINSELGFH